MKKLLTLLLALPLLWGHAAAQENAKYTILLTGASFASPQNGWFEIGCRQLEARALNRAVGGESIADTANRMAEGTLWNAGELDALDALVIMQVHNRDVSATGGLKEKYTDYTTPFDRSNYAAAFDYVKLGGWVEALGPLTAPATNQRLYRVGQDGTMEDITELFRRKP